MLFLTPPQDAAAIRAFCARFNEGLRVEYKSTFDENVRRNLPKIISSFANSLGGVLIVGINAENGIPQRPIQGFETPDEELGLTVENICLQGINPPVAPRTTVVPSDIESHVFLIIEVDESLEAPHAIENSRRVYVRTGNAANPYEGADVDLIIELFKRRTESNRKYERLLAAARKRAGTAVADSQIHMVVEVCPTYPRRTLCDRNQIWNFLNDARFRGARYYPLQTLRRIADGVGSFDQGEQYSQISAFGLLFVKRVLALHQQNNRPDVILVGEIFHPLLRLLHCAKTFYSAVGYRGNLEVNLSAVNVRTQSMPFIEDPFHYYTADDFRCFEDTVSVGGRSSTELFHDDVNETVQSMLGQLCWSFWQSHEEFPAEQMRRYIARVIAEMRL
jgi:hypothetical protein